MENDNIIGCDKFKCKIMILNVIIFSMGLNYFNLGDI